MTWEKIHASEDGDVLVLKGFLFQGHDSQWILSKEPDVKSCCIGAAHKAESQLTLLGDFSQYKTNVPLIVQGVMNKNENVFALREVSINKIKTSPPYLTAAGLFICIASVIFISRIKLKRLPLP